MHIFFLIRSLGHGGAERQLIELVKALDRSRYRVTVATFYDGGAFWPELESIEGVRVLSLRKKGRWDLLPFLVRLIRAVRAAKPDVLHGYMGFANELCSLIGPLVGARVVWGVRMSDRDASQYDWLSAWSLRTGAWLSRFADRVIVNSFAGERDHLARGYPADRITVIHNGINIARFRPDAAARQAMRRAWQIADDEFAIGMIGRLDPQKDHPTFLRAAGLVAKRHAKVRFICVGDGPPAYKDKLQAFAKHVGLNGEVKWASPSNDVLGVYNALDLATLTSANGEGFANVVGEAMACGVPVVVTNAGDCALIVGNPEQVVPTQQPEALAAAWLRVLEMPPAERAALGARQRARIAWHFNVQQLAAKTLAALESIR